MIEVKNSGVDWIGEIPAYWEVKRIKDVANLNPNYIGNDLNGEVSFVPMESLRCGKIDYQQISFAEAKGKYTSFADEDLLIAKVTPCFENGNISLAKNMKQGIGFGSSEIFVLRCFNISNNYMFYYALSSLFQGHACATMCGVGGLKRISPHFMRTYEFAIPPIAEQQAIADYLDKKTAEIDEQITLLEHKQNSYAKLKQSLISQVVTRGLNPNAPLKNSGIDWIGEIPAHWEIRRLKDIANFYTGNSLNESEKEIYGENMNPNSLPYIGTKDVERNKSQINYNSGYSIPNDNTSFAIAPKGATLICVEGGSAGKKIGFIEQDVCFVNKLCCAKSLIDNDKFVYYYFNTNLFVNQFNRLLQGMIGGVSINKIKCMLFFVPPIEEQQAIADYLDEKTAEIDEQISNIDKKINTYKRLKQSLIDEVVTGKRKI